MIALLGKCHLRNKNKMLPWDTPLPLHPAWPGVLSKSPRDSLLPYQRGPGYQQCARPDSPPCPSDEASQVCSLLGGTERGPVRALRMCDLGIQVGQGATWSLWLCHERSHAHSLKCIQASVLVWVSVRRGSPLMLQDSVRGLRISALSACSQRVNIYLQYTWWTFRSSALVHKLNIHP